MTPDQHLDADTRRAFGGLAWSLVGLLLYLGVWCAARAGTEVTQGVWDGYAGTRIVVQDAASEADCAAKLAALGAGKYTCRSISRVTVTADAPPAVVDCVVSEWGAWVPVATWSACVDGQQTRQEVRARTIVTQPVNGGAACPALDESRTVTQACTVAPPPPPPGIQAPTIAAPVVTPNATNTANSNVKVSWNAVTGATSYKLQRCTGANCSANFTQLKWDSATSYSNTNLPPGITYGYRVQGTTSSQQGLWSAVVYATTPTNTTEPPPPPPPAGAATLQWTAPTQNTDGSALTNLAGFRVVYGTAPGSLTQSVQVANAALSSYVVSGLASGTWYFAVAAYTTSGYESALSNIASKVVP